MYILRIPDQAFNCIPKRQKQRWSCVTGPMLEKTLENFEKYN